MADRDRRHTMRVLKEEVEKRLAYEQTGVFSKTEILRSFRHHVDNSVKAETAATYHRNGMISRRKFLKLMGFGLAGGVLVSAGIGKFMGKNIFDERTMTPTGYTTLSVSDGDDISGALNSAMGSGETVRIPEGTYYVEADALDFTGSNAALIGEGSGVTFEDFSGRPTIRADGGDVRYENISVMVDPGSGFAIDAQNGTLQFIGFDAITTSYDPNEMNGFLTRFETTNGNFVFERCQIEGFADNGIYLDQTPYTLNAHVNCCILVNNNIDQVRTGAGTGDPHLVEGCLFIQDEPITPHSGQDGAQTGRGVRHRYDGNAIIRNNDFIYTWSGGSSPIVIHRLSGGTATLENNRIRSDHNTPIAYDTSGATLEGSGNHLTGDNTDVSGNVDPVIACAGDGCDAPTEETECGDTAAFDTTTDASDGTQVC